MNTYFCPECRTSGRAVLSHKLDRMEYALDGVMENTLEASYQIDYTVSSYEERGNFCVACGFCISSEAVVQVSSSFGNEEVRVQRLTHYVAPGDEAYEGGEGENKPVDRRDGDKIDHHNTNGGHWGMVQEKPALSGRSLRAWLGERWSVMAYLDDDVYSVASDVSAIQVQVHLEAARDIEQMPSVDWRTVDIFDRVFVLDVQRYLSCLKAALCQEYPDWAFVKVNHFDEGFEEVYENELRYISF